LREVPAIIIQPSELIGLSVPKAPLGRLWHWPQIMDSRSGVRYSGDTMCLPRPALSQWRDPGPWQLSQPTFNSSLMPLPLRSKSPELKNRSSTVFSDQVVLRLAVNRGWREPALPGTRGSSFRFPRQALLRQACRCALAMGIV
jgi:hypothetical protein